MKRSFTRDGLSPCAAVAAAALVVAGVVGFAPASPASAVSHQVQATVYASPSGSGTACTSAAPCSLPGARTFVRNLDDAWTGDVVVELADGTYRLSETLELTAADSGQNGYNVIYRAAAGASPVISGGTHIAGSAFTQVGSTGVYVADASVSSRHLYVDGERAVRARGPVLPSTFTSTSTGYPLPDIAPYLGMDGWNDKSDIEVVAHFSWKRSRYSVESITTSGGIDIDNAGWVDSDVHYAAKNAGVWIENARELLDEPGEWYLDDNDNKLYYKPLTGQAIATASFELGTTHKLITGAGSDSAPLHHVEIDGVTFAHDGWTGPSSPQGYIDFQGGAVINSGGNPDGKDWKDLNVQTPSAVTFTHAHDISVKNSTFTHLSNSALTFGAGTHDSHVVNNTISDASGGGINIGGILKSDHNAAADKIVRNIAVVNNTITEVGVEHHGAVGIFLGYTKNVTVSHNTLSNLPYTGISVGWGWGEIDALQPTFHVGGNTISYNLVRDVMLTNHDGGAIYTLGKQTGSTLTGNYLYSTVGDYAYIYHDNGSEGWRDTYNVINGQGPGTHIWYYTNTDYNWDAPTHFGTWDNKATYNWVSARSYTWKITDDNSAVMDTDAPTDATANIAVTNNWPAGARAVMAAAGAHASIALGATSTATSEYSSAYAAAKAVDGDASTRWAQAASTPDPSSLTVDLGSERLVTGVLTDAYLYFGAKVNYKLEYATTADVWQTYADHTVTPVIPGFDQKAGGPVTARWLRLTFTGTAEQGGSINELTVFGERPELSISSATASTQYSTEYSAAKAIDADDSSASRWAQESGGAAEQTLTADLGSVKPVGAVDLSMYLHEGKDIRYVIEYANTNTSGTDWKTFADRSTTGYDWDDVAVIRWKSGLATPDEPVSARYIRISFVDTQSQGASIQDLAIYGR